jgi:hypothetical protein
MHENTKMPIQKEKEKKKVLPFNRGIRLPIGLEFPSPDY